MDRFNPELTLTSSEAAELLEVHPSTVKRWCNDGELPSEKTEGGHRRIHLEEVVAFARERGIANVLAPFHPYEAHVWTALREVREGSFKRLHALAMGWVARGQLRRLTALYDALARDPSVPLCRFCDEGVRGLMTRVGEAWAEGRLRVGEEHLVSQAMTEVLLKLRADQRVPAPGPRSVAPVAIVGTMEGNQHHLGSLCVRILLERLGWEVFYLGPDVPLEDFAVIQRGREASLVCVSLPPGAQPGDVGRAVRVLGGLYDAARPYTLAFGGSAGAQPAPEILAGPFESVHTFSSCEALREAIQEGFAQPLAGVAR